MAQGFQTSAIDPAQQAYAERKVRQREVRLVELWRWLLTQKMGREFLWDVLLADVGYDHPIHDQADVALRNLAVRWMNTQVRRHRDLYLQMLNEASKREDDDQKEEDTMRAGWARQASDEDHDD